MPHWGESYAHKAAVFADTDWWKEEALHTMQYLPLFGSGSKIDIQVLDVGCNLGAWEKLARKESYPHTIHAMDVNTYAVDVLKSEDLPNVITHTDLNTVPKGLDYVVMMHVINQIENLEETLASIWRKMNSGATIVVVTHNPIPSKFRWLENKIKGYKPDPTMVREPRLGELNQLMYDNGFKHYSSFYFGKKLVPFLNRRIMYVGTKP